MDCDRETTGPLRMDYVLFYECVVQCFSLCVCPVVSRLLVHVT